MKICFPRRAFYTPYSEENLVKIYFPRRAFYTTYSEENLVKVDFPLRAFYTNSCQIGASFTHDRRVEVQTFVHLVADDKIHVIFADVIL